MPIKMVITKGGHVRVMPGGYAGSTCNEATRPYTERLSGVQIRKEGEAEEMQATQSLPVNQQQQASQ